MAWGRELLLRMFGRPKGFLGRLGGVIMARANRDAAEQVIKLLDVRLNVKVLEVGFGPGVGIQLLLERVTGGWVAGVDQSQEMVRQAAARNASALRNRRVDLRYGSVERPPFANETFDKVLAINSMQVWPDARAGLQDSPWQNCFAERLIGSIRRECLDQFVILGEAHLRRILGAYAAYYNVSRTHRSLEKDAPFSRPVQRTGSIHSHAILGGLHHHYVRV